MLEGEQDLFNFVFFPDNLTDSKKKYIESSDNLKEFISFYKKLKDDLKDEISVVSKLKLNRAIPNYDPQITIVLEELQEDIHINSDSVDSLKMFHDHDNTFLARTHFNGQSTNLTLFTKSNIDDYQITLTTFPNKKFYTINDYPKPIELGNIETINKIELQLK